MTFYSYALLLHIAGVLIMFIAVGLEQAVLFRLRAAKTTTLVREWMRVMSVVEKMFPVASMVILGAGLYMVFTVWGWSQAWVDVSLGVFLLTSVMAPTVSSPRFKAIHKTSASAPGGLVSDELWQLIHDPMLLTSVFVMDFLTVGIVCLMTIKPGWIVALAIVLVAFVAALMAARVLSATKPSSEALRQVG